jgi:hypothetical protein
MKKTLLTLALVTMDGAAGAHSVGGTTVTTPSVGSSTATTTPQANPPTVTNATVPSRPVGTAGATVNTPAVGSSTVRTPMVGSAGATVPSANAPSATTPGVPSATTPNTASLPAAPNARGSGSARSRIEADGYKNVTGLTRNADGSWGGKAMRGSSLVDVQVDSRGHVISK